MIGTGIRRRRTTTACLVLVVGLVLTACTGGSASSRDRAAVASVDRSGNEPSEVDPTGSPTAGLRLGTRPDPVPGVVTVQGAGHDVITAAVTGFTSASTGTTVDSDVVDTARAFERLCVGEVDVVDSSRSLTAAEHDACRANGLDVVQLRVAADALVVATGTMTDVGTDCLTTDQLDAAVAAGSTVESWSQLGEGLDATRFAVVGPAAPFGAAVRSDYRVTGTDDATRVAVAGPVDDGATAASLATLRPLRAALRARLGEARADGVRAVVERVAARLAPVERRYRAAVAAGQRLDARVGVMGLVSQGYYVRHERGLRALEVEVADDDPRRGCVLPDDESILDGSYPLARPVLLTVSSRSLERPEVRALLTYTLAHAVTLAADAGVVAPPAPEIEQQLSWLADGVFPRFDVDDDGALVAVPDDVGGEGPAAPEPETPVR